MESEFVATGKKKQDVIVCDSSSTVKVTLWEENIDILEEQASYCLQNFVVHEFSFSKYLGMAMDHEWFPLHGDIREVRQADQESGCSKILNAAIIGVSHLGIHKIDLSEMQCESRAIHLNTEKMHEVRVCDVATVQYICADQLSAKMLFMAGSKIYSLNVYGKVIKDLALVADDTAVTKGLMKFPSLSSVTYNDMSLWLSQTTRALTSTEL